MQKREVYLAMLQLVNLIHVVRNETNEPETAIKVEKMFVPLATVLDHLESCPARRMK